MYKNHPPLSAGISGIFTFTEEILKVKLHYSEQSQSLNRKYMERSLNPFWPIVALNMKTSHIVCTASQVTGFYIQCNCGLRVAGTEAANIYHIFDI